MANRFPLVINNTTTVVGELLSGDNLNLSLSGIYDGTSSGTSGQYLKATGTGTVVWGNPGDVYLTATQTIQNKTLSTCTISGLSNTLTNIPNASLSNSTITINGTAISLGGNVLTPNDNTTYTLSTTGVATNSVNIVLTAGGSGGSSSLYNIIGSNIAITRSSSGDLTFAPNLGLLTFGSYLTGTSYNGLSDVTIAVNGSTSGTSNIVARDASGNFSAGSITATSFIKSGGTSSQFLKADGSVDTNTYLTSAPTPNNGTLTMNVSGTGLSGSATFTADQSTASTFTVSSNATSSGTTSGTIVARGTNGDFTAGNITATSFIKSGGTSAQFLKADGSVDSNQYTTQAFPSGTVIPFFQAFAPTGWTQVTTHNDKALKVVNGTGGGYGGSVTFSSAFSTRTPSGSVSVGGSVTVTNNSFTLSNTEIPSHTHEFGADDQIAGQGSYVNIGGFPYDAISNTGGSGQRLRTRPDTSFGGGSHVHNNSANFSGNGSFTGNGMDFNVQYIEIIICSKN